MTTRTLAFMSSALLFAPLFATDAFAQRPIGVRPPVVEQRDNRDLRGGPDRGRFDRYAYERARMLRERERLAALAFRDGYDAGLRAGRDRRRFDPGVDSRYRSGDRGYHRDFGPRDLYRSFYRDAFRDGYERGYMDARRGPGLTLWWRW